MIAPPLSSKEGERHDGFSCLDRLSIRDLEEFECQAEAVVLDGMKKMLASRRRRLKLRAGEKIHESADKI